MGSGSLPLPLASCDVLGKSCGLSGLCLPRWSAYNIMQWWEMNFTVHAKSSARHNAAQGLYTWWVVLVFGWWPYFLEGAWLLGVCSVLRAAGWLSSVLYFWAFLFTPVSLPLPGRRAVTVSLRMPSFFVPVFVPTSHILTWARSPSP